MSDKPTPTSDAGGGGLPFERPIREIEERISELETLAGSTSLDLSGEIVNLRRTRDDLVRKIYGDLTAWQRVGVARHPARPVASDYLATAFREFVELHGDRAFGDDRAMVAGLAVLGTHRVMLVGHRKGRTTKERLDCNFGCAHPEGYRKALRVMRLADRLGLPIVSLVNTPGAYPGIGAEERGQAMAIAESIRAMFTLRVPIVVTIIGEGGSGGALGIGVGDRVVMMEHAYYSVISPEGCAAILWKDGERSPDAAEALKLTSKDLASLGVIDEIVTEPLGGAHRAPEVAIRDVASAIQRHLDELCALSPEELLAQRREKFRHMAAIEGRFPVHG